MVCGGMNWTKLAHDGTQCRVQLKAENFFNYLGNYHLFKKTLLNGVICLLVNYLVSKSSRLSMMCCGIYGRSTLVSWRLCYVEDDDVSYGRIESFLYPADVQF
jgi:hypothetical protein